jgi:hypothetical protein
MTIVIPISSTPVNGNDLDRRFTLAIGQLLIFAGLALAKIEDLSDSRIVGNTHSDCRFPYDGQLRIIKASESLRCREEESVAELPADYRNVGAVGSMF